MNTDKEIKEMVNRSIAKLLYKTKRSINHLVADRVVALQKYIIL